MPRWLDIAGLRFPSLAKHRRVESELDREIQAHIDHLTEESIARGMSPADARNAALRAFGNVSVTKEEVRDMRGVSTAENLLRDLRYTLRALARLSVTYPRRHYLR